jgi:hypothetical protein
MIRTRNPAVGSSNCVVVHLDVLLWRGCDVVTWPARPCGYERGAQVVPWWGTELPICGALWLQVSSRPLAATLRTTDAPLVALGKQNSTGTTFASLTWRIFFAIIIRGFVKPRAALLVILLTTVTFRDSGKMSSINGKSLVTW